MTCKHIPREDKYPEMGIIIICEKCDEQLEFKELNE